MEPYWSDDTVTLWLGDCREVLAGMPDASVDAVITDPPAGISFMGKTWDADKGGRDAWVSWLTEVMREVRRVLKPGGHALVWALPRTSHWTATALEDADLGIRDCIVHIFGSGFPKSLDVSKAIDKAAGANREVVGNTAEFSGRTVGRGTSAGYHGDLVSGHCRDITIPATEDAARWEGWGTALKPGQEHWWLCRKPLNGSVVSAVLEHGTGALNIDACRIAVTDAAYRRNAPGDRGHSDTRSRQMDFRMTSGSASDIGRWPTNLVFTHSATCVEDGPCEPDCPVAELDRQSGQRTSGTGAVKRASAKGGSRSASIGAESRQEGTPMISYGDTGGASRFFPVFRYEAKAPASERPKLDDGTAHATVKPLDLMRWLVRLATPPGGLVLDPFAGSGTTGEACVLEGFRAVLVELERPHAELIKQRLRKPLQPTLDLFSEVSDAS